MQLSRDAMGVAGPAERLTSAFVGRTVVPRWPKTDLIMFAEKSYASSTTIL